jgi:hypothetical protein
MKTPVCLTALTTSAFILSNSSNPVIPSNNLKTPSHKGLMSSVAKNRIGDRIGERQCVVALAQH